MKRRLLSLLLVMLLLVTAFPAPAAAAEKKLVAFTFDDGPSPYTAELLDGLKQRGAYATFFMTGANGRYAGIVHQKKVLTRMWQEGHQLANHTYSHNTRLGRVKDDGILQEKTSVSELIFQAVGGQYQDMVRTPGGVTDGRITTVMPAPIILWGTDTMDWKYRNADTVYKNIIDRVFDGSIVLLHDLYPTSIEGALRAIETLQQQGYECVTVAELMRRRGVTPQNGTIYRKVLSPGQDLPAYTAPTLTLTQDAEKGVQFTVSSKDKGLTFYYTTDGTVPTLASAKYTGPVCLGRSTLVKVWGVDAYGTRTPLTSQILRADSAAVPTFTIDGGKLTLKTATVGAEVYYTTDGTLPTEASTKYTAPFAPAGTVRAVAVRAPLYNSAVLTLTPTAYGDYFTDVHDKDWCYEAVGEVVHQKLMNGTAPGYFEPNALLTRGAVVAILYRLAGSPAVETAAVAADVAPTDWCAGAVKWAMGQGIANVDGEGRFRPGELMDRQTFALMLHRFALAQGKAKADGTLPTVYTDRSSMAKTAVSAFAWCISEGVITGTDDTTLAPLSKLSRAQCAVILLRFEKAMGM